MHVCLSPLRCWELNIAYHASLTSINSFDWWREQTAWRVSYSNAKWRTLSLPFWAVWMYNIWNHTHYSNILYTRRLCLQYEEPVCEWVSIFTKTQCLCEWNCKLWIHSWMGLLCWTFKATSLILWMDIYNRQNTMGPQYTICYGPIHEWASIFFQLLLFIQYIIDYAPIHE